PAGEIRGMRLQTPGPGKAATNPEPSSSETNAPAANITIFTNLDRPPTDRYNIFAGSLIAGSDVSSQDEVWQALPFMPRVDVHARTLAAAIGYLSGTRLVNVGIYSDNAGTVGTPLPGGQGSTTDIPDS